MQACELMPEFVHSLRTGDYDRAKELRIQIIISELQETDLFSYLAEIVFYFENKYKFSFKNIHRCDDDSYIVKWRENDKKAEHLRVNYFNNWLHEKVQPLINDLPEAAKKQGLVLDMMTQPRPGKFSVWMSTPDGLKLYTEYQTF